MNPWPRSRRTLTLAAALVLPALVLGTGLTSASASSVSEPAPASAAPSAPAATTTTATPAAAAPTATSTATATATSTATATATSTATATATSTATAAPATAAPTATLPTATAADSASPAQASGLLVTYADGATPALPASTVSGALDGVDTGTVATSALSGTVSVVSIGATVPASSLADAAATLAAEPGVVSVVPDRVFTAQADAINPVQWNLQDASTTDGGYSIRVPAAWTTTEGSSSVVVADLDTGTTKHPATNGIYTAGYDFISDAASARDGNGWDADPTDEGDWTSKEASSWHGTAVSSLIAGQASAPFELLGSAPGVRVEPVRVLGKAGANESDVIEGIYWAAGKTVPGTTVNTHIANVINLSLGGDGKCDSAFQSAITYAVKRGIAVVTAAGNSSANVATDTPSNCAGVISVASSTRAGGLASYSDFGGVTLAAPGGDTTGTSTTADLLPIAVNQGTTTATTATSSSYALGEGTSFSAPQVSGVIALMLSVAPTLSLARIRSLLTTTATPFPAGSSCSTVCGAGVVNAGAAVAAASAERSALVAATTSAAAATVTLHGTARVGHRLLARVHAAGASTIRYQWKAGSKTLAAHGAALRVPVSARKKRITLRTTVTPPTGAAKTVVSKTAKVAKGRIVAVSATILRTSTRLKATFHSTPGGGRHVTWKIAGKTVAHGAKIRLRSAWAGERIRLRVALRHAGYTTRIVHRSLRLP